MNIKKTIAAVPLYKKIYLDIKQKIQSKILKPGQKLPSELYLCQKYSVSRITVRKALKLLTEENLIVTTQGKGSYVNVNKIVGKLRGFLEFPLSTDKKCNQMILKREILKNSKVAKLLLLPSDEDLIYIKSLFFIEKLPIAINEAWFPAKRFPDLLTNIGSKISKGMLLYDFLEKKYHENIASSCRKISTALSNDQQNKLLKLSKFVPLFEVEKTVYNQFKEPVEYTHYVVRGDKISYNIDAMNDSQVYLSSNPN